MAVCLCIFVRINGNAKPEKKPIKMQTFITAINHKKAHTIPIFIGRDTYIYFPMTSRKELTVLIFTANMR